LCEIAIDREVPAILGSTAGPLTRRGGRLTVNIAIDIEVPDSYRAIARPQTRRGGRPPVVPVALVNRDAFGRTTTVRGGRPPANRETPIQRQSRPRTRTRRQRVAIQDERAVIADIIIEEVFEPVIGPLAMIGAPKCQPKVEVSNLIVKFPQGMPIFFGGRFGASINVSGPKAVQKHPR